MKHIKFGKQLLMWAIFLSFFVPACVSSCASQAWGNDEEKIASNSDEPLHTPGDRVKESMQKLKENPSLRGRSDKRALEPAKEVYISENLPMKVLSDLKRDASVSEMPVLLKTKMEGDALVVEGFVNSSEEKNLIEEKIKAIPGVKKVDNRLKIKKSNKDLLGEKE